MQPRLRWSFAILAGVLAGAVTYFLADWPALVPGAAIVTAVAIGYFLRARAKLEARSGWHDDGDARASGYFAALLSFAGPLLLLALEGTTFVQELAVLGYLLVFAVGCLGVGVEFALSGLDAPDA